MKPNSQIELKNSIKENGLDDAFLNKQNELNHKKINCLLI